jgi:hypothetical protein
VHIDTDSAEVMTPCMHPSDPEVSNMRLELFNLVASRSGSPDGVSISKPCEDEAERKTSFFSLAREDWNAIFWKSTVKHWRDGRQSAQVHFRSRARQHRGPVGTRSDGPWMIWSSSQKVKTTERARMMYR